MGRINLNCFKWPLLLSVFLIVMVPKIGYSQNFRIDTSQYKILGKDSILNGTWTSSTILIDDLPNKDCWAFIERDYPYLQFENLIFTNGALDSIQYSTFTGEYAQNAPIYLLWEMKALKAAENIPLISTVEIDTCIDIYGETVYCMQGIPFKCQLACSTTFTSYEYKLEIMNEIWSLKVVQYCPDLAVVIVGQGEKGKYFMYKYK